MSKDTYKFSGHTDYWRRFGSQSEHVADTSAGKAVYFWRDALWTVYETCGACVGYVATRIGADGLTWRGTKAAYTARGLQKPIKSKPFVCDLEFGSTMQGRMSL